MILISANQRDQRQQIFILHAADNIKGKEYQPLITPHEIKRDFRG